jgi:hypothetical protein
VLCLAAAQGPFAHCIASPACQLPIGVRLVGPPASTPALSHACKCVSAEQQDNKMTATAQPDGDDACSGSHTTSTPTPRRSPGKLAIHHLTAIRGHACLTTLAHSLSYQFCGGGVHCTTNPQQHHSKCTMNRLCAQRLPRLRPNITQSRPLPMLSLGLSSCSPSTVDWLSIGRYPSFPAGEEQDGHTATGHKHHAVAI